MDVTAGAGEWEVLLSTPADVGDFGLHQDADVAAAAFRRQFARDFEGTAAAAHGAAAEKQFRAARGLLAGKPVLWSGFLMLMTPAALGASAEAAVAVVGPEADEDPEELARLRTLAEVPAMFVVQLSVQVGRLAPYVPGAPMAQTAALARGLQAKYGKDAGVHHVRYGTVSGVATVRTVEHEVAGTPLGEQASFAADSPPLEHLIAEVSLLFPQEEALVTVTAGATHGAALQDAVLLAGSIAQTVRVRRPDAAPAAGPSPAGTTTAGEPAEARGSAVVPVRLVLPDGTAAAAGTTLLGRAPRPAAQDAEHAVIVSDDSVSRSHLLLRLEGGRAWATDLRSSNGTLLQRAGAAPEPLAPGVETELAAGDVVNLGSAIIHVVADVT